MFCLNWNKTLKTLDINGSGEMIMLRTSFYD